MANRGRVTQAERNADDVVLAARQAVADLLGGEPAGVVFGRSATQLAYDFSRVLSAGWGPRNGVERQLIDTMAQAQAGYLSWLQTLTVRTDLESCTNDRMHKEEARWGPPRQSDADALDQAAAMMDRFNRVFLRTLRALCDLRRPGRRVVVQGGQVNVAERQVNVSTAPPAAGG